MTDALVQWVNFVTRRAVVWLVVIAVLSLVLGWVAVDRFRLNSDLSTLITQEADWRKDFDYFEATFPDLVRTAVVVVYGTSLHDIEVATGQIKDYLGERPGLYRAVSAPGSEAFFRDHALLYMDVDDLDDMADRLSEAQPWLTSMTEEPGIAGLLDLVRDGLENDPPEGLGRIIDLLTASAERHNAGEDSRILWTDEFFELDEPRYQLIYTQAAFRGDERVSHAEVVVGLRDMLATIDLPESVTVKLTGELPLQHEEIEAAVGGVTMAGWLSLVLLLVVLTIGVRSGKIIVATFLMLAVGIVWTSAYAMLTVGEYNTLSVVFIVMFFGLGVDFALHFSLRYQEAINRGDTQVSHALAASAHSVGRAISLCTITTAIGFLGFWPTDYEGLADLGVISAGGMVIAWFLTFTFLPAFYKVVGPPRAHEMDLPTSDRVVSSLIAHRPVVIGVVVVTGVLAVGVASRSSFDYSTLALKDASSESMETLRLLQREGMSTDYQLFVVSDEPLREEVLETLDVVDEVSSPYDLVPQDQEEKLFVVDDLNMMLFSALEPVVTERSSAIEIRRAIMELEASLADLDTGSAVSASQVSRLQSVLREVLTLGDDDLERWQTAVVANLESELDWLRRALSVEELTIESLPQGVRDRVISAQGKYLSAITPAEDIAPVEALSRFIGDVRDIEPGATGRPVIEWGVGGIVIDAFREALVFAVVAIALVLIIALRRVATVLIILVPLALSAVFTFAASVLFDQPVNMANILVLPLIFGLGVDNGIHVVDRYLGEGDVAHLMHSSTPRAVLLSTLTTIGAFSALSLSAHAGTASIGLLLTFSVGFLLLFTVFLLPVLLARRDR